MFVRGPKARGAVRAAGLADVGISSDETTATLVDMLLAEGVRGKTVVPCSCTATRMSGSWSGCGCPAPPS